MILLRRILLLRVAKKPIDRHRRFSNRRNRHFYFYLHAGNLAFGIKENSGIAVRLQFDAKEQNRGLDMKRRNLGLEDTLVHFSARINNGVLNEAGGHIYGGGEC